MTDRLGRFVISAISASLLDRFSFQTASFISRAVIASESEATYGAVGWAKARLSRRAHLLRGMAGTRSLARAFARPAALPTLRI
jgi:hypothetical protein